MRGRLKKREQDKKCLSLILTLFDENIYITYDHRGSFTVYFLIIDLTLLTAYYSYFISLYDLQDFASSKIKQNLGEPRANSWKSETKKNSQQPLTTAFYDWLIRQRFPVKLKVENHIDWCKVLRRSKRREEKRREEKRREEKRREEKRREEKRRE